MRPSQPPCLPEKAAALHRPNPGASTAVLNARRFNAGMSLIELMVAMTIGLVMLVALVTLFVNTSRNNAELARTNSQIESGRFAMQLLQSDLSHAGFWGTHVPQFDDLTLTTAPGDVPTAVPDPCLPFNTNNWDSDYQAGMIGMAIQVYDTAPAGCSGVVVNQQPNTDILVVRHAETCIAGSGANCAAEIAGGLYFQSAQCAGEIGASALSGNSSTTIRLAANASATDAAYAGMTLRITSGTGAGQVRTVASYDGTLRTATLATAWTVTPDATSVYSFDPVLATSGFNLHRRDCVSIADKRRFISTIYYVRDFAVSAGDGIPTLVQSRFNLQSGSLAFPNSVTPLIEGIETLRVELGLDMQSDTGAAVNLAQPVTWADATNLNSPTNRGDGSPEGEYVRCSSTTPCTASQLINAVSVRLFVVARTREATPGFNDTKTYALGSDNWSVPAGSAAFKRHVFSGAVRLTNISGRRETP